MALTDIPTDRPTTVEDWKQSDDYHKSYLHEDDPSLTNAIERSRELGLPEIAVSPSEGKLLKLVAESIGAKRILEVGTLGGYSTIWLAKGLSSDGSIVTLELSNEYAKVARENLEVAGLANKVNILIGSAAETLKSLPTDPPFDMAFIDADKPRNLTYFTEAKRLVRKGGVIIVDNMVRNGRVADHSFHNDEIEGIRKLLHALKGDTDVDATTIGTVGERGYDGFLYAVRK